MRAPMPYRAERDQQDQLDEQDPTLNPDKANANDNGSSTPPAPAGPQPYKPPVQDSYKPATPTPTTQAPTFSQMQANGEARPPMPSAPAPSGKDTTVPANAGPSQIPANPTTPGATPGTIATMSGDWTPPTAAPNSAPLIQSAAGGTMTPQGDASNSFKGYVSSQGGSFGGAYADKKDPQLWGAVANGDPQSIVKAMSGDDPALRQEAASAIARNLSISDKMRGGYEMLSELSPEQRAAVGQIWNSQNGGFAQNRAGYSDRSKNSGIWANQWENLSDMANAGLDWNQAQQGGAIFGGVKGAGQNAIRQSRPLNPGNVTPVAEAPINDIPQTAVGGNWTAKDPALQQKLLAEGATAGSTGQAGAAPPTTPGTPYSPTANKPAINVAGGQASQPGSQPATGTAGVPGANPTSTDILGMLMGGAQGKGAGSEVQGATQQAILDQLKNPNAYNSDAVKSAYGWMGGNIDDQYALQQKDLEEEMAQRGLSTSTIGAGRLSDLNIGRRSAKSQLAQDLGQKMAESQQSANGQAIAQGLGGGTTAQNNQMDWLKNLMGYGQQGFENDMTTAKFNNDQNNQWQQFLMQMLGQGYGTAGA